jgi:hypothetical protein
LSSKKVLTAARLRKLFAYDPDTGVLTNLISRGKARVGAVAGTLQSMGYQQVSVYGRKFLGHRLAWLHFYGSWPNGNLDHVDRDPQNNRICNLRLANGAQNRANSRRPNNNSTGRKGVYLYRRRWHAKINKDHEQRYLGSFDSIEAAAAYAAAAKQIFGDFARTD